MKIMLVVTGLGVGGAERLVVNIADIYSNMGHEVTLVCLHGPLQLVPCCKKIRVVNLRLRKNPMSFIIAMCAMKKLVRQFNPDVVNSHMVHANLFCRVFRLFSGVNRLVCSAHNTNEGGFFRIFLYRVTDWLADISTNVSDEAVAAFVSSKAVPKHRMVSIHNGIDTDAFLFDEKARHDVRTEFGFKKTDTVYLSVGRLSQQKDYPNLLRAFAKVSEKSEHSYLMIVGEGPLGGFLSDYAVSLGISHKVIFAGIRYDIPNLLSACDIFVLSSAWEGFGLVVAEAMSCERPVIATDCGGVKEVVGNAGVLVKTNDSQALAKAMLEVSMWSSENKKILGIKARKRIADLYSIHSAAEKYLSIYL